MRPTPYTRSSSPIFERGFSLIELVVALGLGGGMVALVTTTVIFQSKTYVQDIVRSRVQDNLRGAMDIMAIDIRQAGESVNAHFPAVTLGPDTNPAAIRLTMRRKTLPEVLTLCKPIANGDTKVFVSDITATTNIACTPPNITSSCHSECFPANAGTAWTTWSQQRATNGGQLRAYIYDYGTKQGQFLDYTADGIEGSDHFVLASPLPLGYTPFTSNIFLIEEHSYTINPTTKTLQMYADGFNETFSETGPTTPQDVAYHVTNFQASLTMSDNTTRTSLQPTDTYNWKQIKSIRISLSGQDSWRSQTYTHTLTGEYFPRNILSN